MTEKQASSEIAQSRARFEKAAKPYFNNGESFCPWDGDHYADEIAEGMWQMYLAAERDTRERVAQLVEEEARNWNYSDINPPNEAVDLFAENVCERIRGEGVSR
jgi:hypothetical protein